MLKDSFLLPGRPGAGLGHSPRASTSRGVPTPAMCPRRCHGATRRPQQVPAALPAARSCSICAPLAVVPSQLQCLSHVDRQHLPPPAVSHAMFSGERGPMPCQEPESVWSCITYTLQRVVRCTLDLTGCGTPLSMPRCDSFFSFLTGGSHVSTTDRSPIPAISASWAKYEENPGLR